MIDKVTVWKRLNSLGVTKTMAEIEAALDTIEQQAILTKNGQGLQLRYGTKCRRLME